MSVAGVAHPVERHLAKVEVASSSLVTRSIKNNLCFTEVVFLFNPYRAGDMPRFFEIRDAEGPHSCADIFSALPTFP